ncbi:peptidase [Pasteurellaceae bacterium RH1A]|nr:peptidase [Pasteurellaceae bacterium RH1A]
MNLIEIFKAGKRPDANGLEVNITPAMLQEAVAAYSPQYHEAPLVVGHPKSNLPAYGWVKNLILDGDLLKAEPQQIDPAFAEMVASGRFKKISASFYLPDSPNNPKKGVLYLRHVGFLGAMPPAVKGLKDPVFNEADQEGIVKFEEPFYQPTPEDNPMDKDKIAELEAKLAEAEKAKTEAEQAKVSAENEAAQLKAEKQAAEEAKAEAENTSFAESLIQGGKLLPKDREAVLSLLNAKPGTADFSESNFKADLKAFLNSLPKHYDFTEPVATKDKVAEGQDQTIAYAEGTNPASIEADQKIRAYMQEHKVSYTAAFNAIYQ